MDDIDDFWQVMEARARRRMRALKWMTVALLVIFAVGIITALAADATFDRRWGPVEEMKQPKLPELVTPPTAGSLPAPARHDNFPDHKRGKENYRDVCQRHGGHRVDYVRDHHASWRCVYPHRGA